MDSKNQNRNLAKYENTSLQKHNNTSLRRYNKISFKRIFAIFILRLFRWSFKGQLPDAKKYVLVIAPHTHALDLIMGKLYNWAIGFKQKVLIKKEFFFFPLGNLLKRWGGIPVDRSKPENIVPNLVNEFDKSNDMVLAITPEGTRQPNPKWKTGFWRIAKAASLPVFMAYIDFKKRELGFLGEFKLSDDMQSDIENLKQHFKGMTGYKPHYFKI